MVAGIAGAKVSSDHSASLPDALPTEYRRGKSAASNGVMLCIASAADIAP
jgi:hypothetical protein